MPLCRRKRVLLAEPSPDLLDAVKSDPNRDVFYLAQTGEIFETYESYSARMSFYRLKQFQCEVTGKSGLDYFQALDSELQEARTMHSRFPEALKTPILKAVQWQVMGRLDHLVEAVFDRFKDRYFKEEKVIVDIQGEKFSARITSVYPPRSNPLPTVPPEAQASTSTTPSTSQSPLSPISDDEPIHRVAADLKLPVKDGIARDDPAKYLYRLQILEEEKPEKSRSAAKDAAKGKWNGSEMEARCTSLSRDRLAFSKSILRRFIRDCVDRDAAVASPWTVKPAIAERYGVSNVMPEETRKGVESIKKGEIEKRKKVWEDKEGPPSKKQKKMTPAQELKVKALAAAAEQREREARAKAEQNLKAKEEAERAAIEKKKKKPIRYPTEDLDVRLNDKEKKAGGKTKRPVPSRAALPFGDSKTTGMFLMAWNFLVVYGQPLHISTFTLDEFEHALRHSVMEPPCALLAEIHSTLIYNLRTVPFVRHSAVISLMELKRSVDNQEEEELESNTLGVHIDDLTAVMSEVGNNWERVPLRFAEGREGWEDALVGCLKDHANLSNFPRLRPILTQLLFQPEPSEEQAHSGTESMSEASNATLKEPSRPRDRYHTLPAEDRVAILAFMCNMAVSSKAIHAHMESCEEQLTALRKEKIDVNRQKKAYHEEMEKLLGATKEKEKSPEKASTNGAEEDAIMQDSSDLSDVPGSEGGSESGSIANGRKRDSSSRNKYHALASQRLKAKREEDDRKQALAEHRRLDEEVNKLERRLEGIEREFRKLLGAIRVKALGRDRFFNRVWWFDGMGSASLLGSGGVVQYGTGRIFIQGPSEFDLDLMEKREEKDIDERRREEEGEEGMLAPGEWSVYNELEEVDEFISWLNPKGARELALKNAFSKWWAHIAPGIRKRQADLSITAKLPDARRSARTKHVGPDIAREPYMLWTNRRAVNGT